MSRYVLSVTRAMLLQGIWFPFAVRILPERGIIRSRQVRAGEKSIWTARTEFPAQMRFDIEVHPDVSGSAWVVIDTAESVSQQRDSLGARIHVERKDRVSKRSISCKIGAAVFSAPNHSWALSDVARDLNLTPAQLSRRIFEEGASFTDIVRTQRNVAKMVMKVNS